MKSLSKFIHFQENSFENVVWKMATILSRHQCVKMPLLYICGPDRAITVSEVVQVVLNQQSGQKFGPVFLQVYLVVDHYGDVIMDAIASQITSLAIVYSIVSSDTDQRKHQSSASLAFVRGIHRGPVNSPHKWPVTRKMFPFDDVIMCFHVTPRWPGWLDNLIQSGRWNLMKPRAT